MTWIDEQFQSARGLHEITSDPESLYNCIAWATGDNTDWWSHKSGYKWPAKRTPMVTSLIAVFRSVGFKKCENGSAEEGYEKVALYAKYGVWKHAARQIRSGKWASKLGEDEDIEHENPECLCGDDYGEIYCYMRRPYDKKAKTRKASRTRR